MKNVTTSEMIKTIAYDYNIDPNIKIKRYFNEFPIIKEKRKISSFYNSIIVDKKGNEYPYMITQNQRNDDKLINFDYIYYIRLKTLEEVVKETNISLNTSKCKICESGGWYSEGIRYEYKDIYCEQ